MWTTTLDHTKKTVTKIWMNIIHISPCLFLLFKNQYKYKLTTFRNNPWKYFGNHLMGRETYFKKSWYRMCLIGFCMQDLDCVPYLNIFTLDLHYLMIIISDNLDYATCLMIISMHELNHASCLMIITMCNLDYALCLMIIIMDDLDRVSYFTILMKFIYVLKWTREIFRKRQNDIHRHCDKMTQVVCILNGRYYSLL